MIRAVDMFLFSRMQLWGQNLGMKCNVLVLVLLQGEKQSHTKPYFVITISRWSLVVLK